MPCFMLILTEVSVGRISIEILMPGLWIVDIEDDWKGLRMHNFWSWQPACQLLYWIMDFSPSLQGELRNHPTKGKSADQTKSGKSHAVPNEKSNKGQICITNFCFGDPSKYYRLVIFKRQQNIICDLGIVHHRLIIVLYMRVPSLFYPRLKKELFQGKFDHYKWGWWKETARDTGHCRWLFLEKKPS